MTIPIFCCNKELTTAVEISKFVANMYIAFSQLENALSETKKRYIDINVVDEYYKRYDLSPKDFGINMRKIRESCNKEYTHIKKGAEYIDIRLPLLERQEPRFNYQR